MLTFATKQCSLSLCSFSQAEIRRLQEANKAARKERQLLLKQQEEIERMRNSTLRLKERLKCAGIEAPPVSSSVIYQLLQKNQRIKAISVQFMLCSWQVVLNKHRKKAYIQPDMLVCSFLFFFPLFNSQSFCVCRSSSRRPRCQKPQGLSQLPQIWGMLMITAAPLPHSLSLEVRLAASCRSSRRCALTWMKSKDFNLIFMD